MTETLCGNHDVILLQETRGKAADILTLPGRFVWTGSFFRASDFDASSRAGGVVVGIRRTVAGAEGARLVEISRGRCVSVELRVAGDSLDVFNVHLDPAMGQSGRVHFLRSIRDYISAGAARPTFAGGDCFFCGGRGAFRHGAWRETRWISGLVGV